LKSRWTTWLAISLWILSIIFFVVNLLLWHGNGGIFYYLQNEALFFLVAFGSMVIVGTLLAIHRPKNPIGWIFLSGAVAQMLVGVADQYADYFLKPEWSDLPQLTMLFWIASWAWVIAFVIPPTFGILLFPTGGLPSKRWRYVAWLGIAGISLLIMADMLKPGSLDDEGRLPHGDNPIGISAISDLINAVSAIGTVGVVILIAGSVASLFFRLRGASREVRQQLKWFAYAAAIQVLALLVDITPPIQSMAHSLQIDISAYFFLFGIAALPAAIGIGILRHQLYDIDRLINRTLVYGSLTILLILGFTANILLFQVILSPFTQGNDVAVAGSTLFAFALFRPIRQRLQEFVDQRFYRRKYDIRLTLESFAITSREAVDLDQLVSELLTVVGTTIQPEHVSVWMTTARQHSRLRR
jgi:hypothetical protein